MVLKIYEWFKKMVVNGLSSEKCGYNQFIKLVKGHNRP